MPADPAPTLRPVRLPADRTALLALDRSFCTDRIYRVARTPASFVLEEQALPCPLCKDFPLADDLGDGAARQWEDGLIAARDQELLGFAAWTHRRWNRRTELQHLYVAPQARQCGLGRVLVAAVATAAQRAGMRGLWLETSTLAYPAIQFYRRLGFVLCGVDLSLYDPAAVEAGETALYFYRPLPLTLQWEGLSPRSRAR